jgi:hypothetical protein
VNSATAERWCDKLVSLLKAVTGLVIAITALYMALTGSEWREHHAAPVAVERAR